jgi:hypothetical protein
MVAHCYYGFDNFVQPETLLRGEPAALGLLQGQPILVTLLDYAADEGNEIGQATYPASLLPVAELGVGIPHGLGGPVLVIVTRARQILEQAKR